MTIEILRKERHTGTQPYDRFVQVYYKAPKVKLCCPRSKELNYYVSDEFWDKYWGKNDYGRIDFSPDDPYYGVEDIHYCMICGKKLELEDGENWTRESMLNEVLNKEKT